MWKATPNEMFVKQWKLLVFSAKWYHISMTHFNYFLLIYSIYVGLFGLFSSHSRIFSLIWRRHHNRWGATKIDLCLALMAIEQWRSITFHTYCDKGQPFIMVISEDPWQSHYISFNDLGPSRPGIEPRSPACEANGPPLHN